jgi:DNA relaxase NicK
MSIKIDWISFTLPHRNIINRDIETGKISYAETVRDEHPHLLDYIFSFSDIKPRGNRKIFHNNFRSKGGGFEVFQDSTLGFTLFEFSGKGIDQLADAKLVGFLVKNYPERMTRLDIAVDMECDIRPLEFVDKREGKRFKSYQDHKSVEGETFYVGSEKSDRFCRVYRYSEGHPRSNLLRAEFVLRSREAKAVADMWKDSSIRQIVSALGQTFGFNHPVWQEKRTDAPLKSAPRETGKGGTERWLFKQVLPAIHRLIEEGAADTVELFDKLVYDALRVHEDEEKHKNEPHPAQNRLEID